MENNETRSLLSEIQGLREEFRQVVCFISELKRDYSVLEEKIELSTSDVLHLLGISKASLARWREANSIPYRYVSSNHVVYPFKGLYLAVKSGRATFKGFDAWKPFSALMPIRTVFSRATWEIHGLYSRSYEHQGRNTEPNQQGTGDFLLLYAY